MLGDWKAACRFTTCVDSALAGSQAEASFFSAFVSLPASGPAAAMTMTQKTRTSHLVRRPPGTRPRARMVFIGLPLDRRQFVAAVRDGPRPAIKRQDISHVGDRARYISLTARESRIAAVAIRTTKPGDPRVW